MSYLMNDAYAFKQVMAQFASSVSIVTTKLGNQLVGITATSFCSLSITPPQILVCIAQERYTHKLISESERFAVNILGAQQLDWGQRFAGMQPHITDRFVDIDYITAVTGCPILPGSIGWLDCELDQIFCSGDHSIFVGNVLAAEADGADSPLLYHNRSWMTLAGHLSPMCV